MTDKGCTQTHAWHNNSQTQIMQHHPTHLTLYTYHVMQCCVIHLYCSCKHPEGPHPHALHIPAWCILTHTHTGAQLTLTPQACHNTHDTPSATHWSLRSYSLPPTPLCSMRNTPRLCGDGRKGREQARACLCSFFRMWVSSHLWKLRCGRQARGMKVKDQVTDMYERLKAGMRHTKIGDSKPQNHKDRETGPESKRRQAGGLLPSSSTQSLSPILYSDPSPSFPAVLCCHSNREAANAAKEAGLTDLACLHGDWGGGATSSNPGSWPLCGTLSPSKRRMGEKEGGSVNILSFSSPPYCRDEPGPWQRDWGDGEA